MMRACTVGSKIKAARMIPLAVMALMLFGTSSVAEAFRNVELGAKAPAFTLKASDGSEIAYSAPTEKPVVVAFLRQGQDKSDQLLKDLGKIAPEVLEKSIVVAILVNPAEGDVKAWAAGAGIPVLLDADQKVYAAFGLVVTPQTAILAPDGTLKHELAGYTSSFKSEAETALREILGMEVDEVAMKGAEVNIAPERKAAMRELQKAEMLIKRKMKSKAVPQVKKAIESDPTYVEAYLLLGDILLEEGKGIDEADAAYKKAAELEPNELMAKVGLARVRAKRGDYEGAAADLEKAALISPKAQMLHYYLGIMHEEAGQFEKAAKSYRKAIEKMLEAE